MFVFGFWIPESSVGKKFIILNLANRIITAISDKGVGSVRYPVPLSLVLKNPSFSTRSLFPWFWNSPVMLFPHRLRIISVPFFSENFK